MYVLLALFIAAIFVSLWIHHLRSRDTSTLGDVRPEQPDQTEQPPHPIASPETATASSSAPAAPAHPTPALSAQALLPQQFVIFDLETTGLSPHSHEIIEFGAIRFTVGQTEHDTFQRLSKPSRKLPRKIVELTGITQEEMDREGSDPELAFREFLEFIGDLPLVAFNAEFDMGFLNATAQRHGVTIANRYTCALKRARRAWPELDSHRLAFIAETFGFPCNNHHRALADCERTLYAFWLATIEVGTKVRWLKPKPFQPIPGATAVPSISLQTP